MKLSARNVLEGKISAIEEGATSAIVTIQANDFAVTADITKEAVADLGLSAGMSAYAVFKASDVMFAVDTGTGPAAQGGVEFSKLSARNVFLGSIHTIRPGAVNGQVSLRSLDGNIITGTISNEAIFDVGLRVGAPAIAIVKSTDVMVGID